jgi:hypothetical protein
VAQPGQPRPIKTGPLKHWLLKTMRSSK